MREADDAFRHQLHAERQANEQQMIRIVKEKEDELERANKKVLEVEDEMRQLLQENAVTRKTLEMRIKKLTSAFTEIQQDLAT
ncbi:leucine-rich repeat and coiled-coil domain-containing protein 1-like [Actinia tenebrosa]|uniref:Leucine-rich repeat and coiled-coil domain-containing protein 1-like n=1 Tax=Actinia tenebrosa TaxID=6105 RepID=A0A6P8I8I2_ACTTE|nr:leucine-rich repeat and coiled-coil domain-containing protein 1-like [Actinia tenebrosa]